MLDTKISTRMKTVEVACDACDKSERGSKQWRPLSLRTPVLVVTLTSTLGLLVVVGYLHWLNQKSSAILTASGGLSLDLGQLFQARYLPTILVVLYGLWVSIVDLEVKRLEPWYQLSSQADSTRYSPLTCTYDTSFVAWVVFNAIKAR